ncbi:hypothetical protein AAY473_025204 [Plecturocebus cupreus]
MDGRGPGPPSLFPACPDPLLVTGGERYSKLPLKQESRRVTKVSQRREGASPLPQDERVRWINSDHILLRELKKFDSYGTPGVVALGLGTAEGVLVKVLGVDPQGQLLGVGHLLHDSRLQVLGGSLGHDIDPAVHDQNDRQRDVEGAQGGEEGVEGLFGDPALLVIVGRRLLPPKERPDGDDGGQDPDTEQRQDGLPPGDQRGVLQRVAHPNVAIDGDGAQAQNGRRAAQDIHGCPNVTEDPPQHPVAQNLQGRREGQDGEAQQQVGHGQVDDEVVGGRPQVPVAGHRQDD